MQARERRATKSARDLEHWSVELLLKQMQKKHRTYTWEDMIYICFLIIKPLNHSLKKVHEQEISVILISWIEGIWVEIVSSPLQVIGVPMLIRATHFDKL